jgi:hypothetical protein
MIYFPCLSSTDTVLPSVILQRIISDDYHRIYHCWEPEGSEQCTVCPGSDFPLGDGWSNICDPWLILSFVLSKHLRSGILVWCLFQVACRCWLGAGIGDGWSNTVCSMLLFCCCMWIFPYGVWHFDRMCWEGKFYRISGFSWQFVKLPYCLDKMQVVLFNSMMKSVCSWFQRKEFMLKQFRFTQL